MDFLQAIVLSVVEGITEFLPISSTGHLVLASKILSIPQTEFVKSFEIFIQLGAILAVVVLYFKRYIRQFKAWKNIVLAFLPTAFVGFLFYNVIKEILLGNLGVTLLALFLGGIILIFVEKFVPKVGKVKSVQDISVKSALLIGLFQSASIIPGVSRAAATIIGGLFLGLSREAAVEFSFLLAIPTLLAATGLDLVKAQFSFSSVEWSLLFVGFLGSFITALIVIKWFIKYVQSHSFVVFGVYRVILALIYFAIFIR